jgi:glycerophosphoryl diester phosphodiesterase
MHAVRQILRSFGLNWRKFLEIHISASVISLVILTPFFSLVMGWLILLSGNRALTDEDILFFAISLRGLPVMLTAGALFLVVVIFQQAAMVIAGHQLANGHSVSLLGLGRQLLAKAWPVFQLALHMISRSVALAAPFIAVCIFIYFSFLTEYDINFYLADKPPAFWWAGGLILVVLLVLGFILLRVFSGWILALPLMLFSDGRPAQILKKSREASASMHIPVVLTLLALLALDTALLGFVSLLTDFAVDGAVALAGDSLQLMAYLLGGLLVLWLIVELGVAFLGNSALCLVILYLFDSMMDNDESSHPVQSLAAHGDSYVSKFRLTVFAILAGLAAGLLVDTAMDRLDTADHAMIIAHRGASFDAPENTMAAIELAIEEGADWVEIDVQETAEGEIVVIHDSDLKRVSGASLRVYESSLSVLQDQDIGSWKDPSFSDQRVPTLQQVLALCKDRIRVIIELKYYGQEEHLEERVAELVEAVDMQNDIAIMSLSYRGIQKMKSVRPNWPVGLLSSVAAGDITLLDADFFAINGKFARRTFIRQAHAKNQMVMVWTINDPVDMSAMMGKGVDGIITDKPGLASAVRMERAKLAMHERILIQLASMLGRQPARPEQ